MRRPPILCLLTLAAAVSVGSTAVAAAPAKPNSQVLDLAPVGVPVIWRGRLVNYVFVTLRLSLRSSADSARLRDQEPYFRDALVRMAHRQPLNAPGDLTHLNDRLLESSMMVESVRIVGPGVVTGVAIVAEAPQHRTGLPVPAPQGAP